MSSPKIINTLTGKDGKDRLAGSQVMGKELGLLNSFQVDLPPHGSVVYSLHD
ncbi:hypothetical protein RBB75_08440 [Tunturibacter empetritectus]|uniref:Uncharacterized protein n=1 Tax=Tunturiibacter empetritectus TaxID=3069691 RepID=A0AAU7ZII7_9BACT